MGYSVTINAPLPNQSPYRVVTVVTFNSAPDRNTLIKGCSEAVTKWKNEKGVKNPVAWKHLYDYGLVFTIELIDIVEQELYENKASEDEWICAIKLRCLHCKSVYEGWQKLQKKYFDSGPYHRSIEYCPQCPPVEVEEWLSGTVRLLKEKPRYAQRNSLPARRCKPESSVTLSLDEMDEFN